MLRCLLLCVIVAGPGTPVVADRDRSPSENSLAERVGGLVEQLDSDRRSERRTAERALLELGPNVLQHLPAPEVLPTASVREAVRRVRRELQRIRAQDSVKPSTVTLDATDSAAAILEEIARQSGNRFDLSAVPDAVRERRTSVRIEERPFWSAVDAVLADAELAVAELDAEGRLVVTPRSEAGAEPLAVAESGPFRVEVASVGRRPLFGDESHDLLRVRVRLMPEPRLRPLFLAYGGGSFTLTADGATLAPLNPEAKYERPLAEGGRRLSLQLDFRVPSDVEPKSVSLSGRMTATVAAGTETIRFPPLAEAEGVARRRGGVTVRVTDVATTPPEGDRDDGSAQVGLSVAYDVGGPAFESHRTWVFHNRVRLEDPAGNAIDRAGSFSTQLQTNGAVALRYRFEGLSGEVKQHRFVYEVPTLIVSVPIDAAFDGLRLGGDGADADRD